MMLANSDLQIIETRDGSLTLHSSSLGASYRSSHGAAGESEHVFVDGSALRRLTGSWTVFELGFGSGRNCLQTIEAFCEATQADTLHYIAIDYAPIGLAFFDALYVNTVHASLAVKIRTVLESNDDNPVLKTFEFAADKKVVLTLHKTHWENIPHDKYAADAIYHDPFGPRENPEAWSERCFAWQKSHLKDTGRLVTYAAASHVRRAMQTSGLVVARAPGFGGKREMTVAAKDHACLEGMSLWKTKPSGELR